MNWTDEQKSAITFRDEKSILLSAAAGSGKTAVLVQRIISRLTDKENPLNINEMLVLTFTEAAAAEMKQKIRKAVQDALFSDPENAHLKKQMMLLHSAQISTIHSFLSSVLRGNAHLSELPIGFSLSSEEEAELLLKQALDIVLERYYKNMDKIKPFYELSVCYGGAKGDLALRESVLKLYSFIRSLPYPKEWLCSSVKNYETLYKEKDIKNTKWQKSSEKIISSYIDAIKECYDAISQVSEHFSEDHPYVSFYSAEKRLVFDMLLKLDNESIAEKVKIISEFRFPAKVRKQNLFPEEEALCDRIREVAKDNFKNLEEFILSAEEKTPEFYKKLYLRAKTLKNIMLMLHRVYTKLKAEKECADFSDLEHGALKLLADEKHQPTALSKDLKKRYKEILIDEYQDTSNIQDEIFSLISRDNKNKFMAGDVKQSIYKFRNAQSALFLDKRERYLSSSDEGEVLTLSKNFRSRKEIISLCNFIFSDIMSASLGDITYDESQALKFGASFSDEEFIPEFYVVTSEEETEDADTLREKEALFIAKRIKELTETMTVTEKDGTKRPLSYKDIVILMRNRSASPIFKAVFDEAGIPLDTDAPKSFLGSREISTVLSLLAILDNPRQDIPLVAVLRSKIFGFSPDELSDIRAEKKGCDFYDALTFARGKSEKVAFFLDELDLLRKKADDVNLFGLLIFIYERYNLFSVFSSYKNPVVRRSNLKILLQRARAFEKSGKHGLFAFMNYIETLKENDKDLSGAKNSSSDDDSVRLMTVHKSKGLEFSVVFLTDTSHKFNLSDSQTNITQNDNLGFCLSFIDEENKIKYPHISSEIFKQIQTGELLSEEMRLLYVALTRAKEKLIITSALNKTSKNPYIFSKDKKPLLCQLKGIRNYAQWLIFSLLTHKDAKCLREFFELDEDIIKTKADFPLKCQVIYSAEKIEAEEICKDLKTQSQESTISASLKKEIETVLLSDKALGSDVPFKVSVSALKKEKNEVRPPALTLGKNIQRKANSEFSPAERGTITHFMLSYLDEKKILSLKDLEAEIEKAESSGIITKPQKDAVDTASLFRLYDSDLFKRLKESKKVFKEYSFYIYVKAKDIKEDLSDDEKDLDVLLQGTIDCFFEDYDGEFVLIDYKTDRITKDEAEIRAKDYLVQLESYSKALYEIFGKKPKERYIYFLSINHAERL